MARDILLLSPTYHRLAHKQTLERNALLVAFLDDEYQYPQGGTEEVIGLMREEGYRDPLSKDIVNEGKMIYRNIYRYFQNDDFRKKVDAFLNDKKGGNKHARYLGVFCLLHDHPDVETWKDIEEKMAQFIAPQPEPQEQTDALAPAEQLPESRPPRDAIPITLRPFRLLADAIQDIAEVEEHLYRTVEELQETITDLQKRTDAVEKENRSLKQDLRDHEQRMAQIEDLLTTDPTQLTAIQTAARRLKRDVVIGLPTHTQIGEYWKKPHSVVYRKKFSRFLRGKGLQSHEKDAIIEAVEQIMVNPFAKSLETEIRWNGDGGEIISGIENRETYYHTHATHPYLRVRWIIREEEGRIHFIDAFRKTTNTA